MVQGHGGVYLESYKRSPINNIHIKVVESNTGVIRGCTVQYKFVNIISYECILHNIIIQDCHFVNECRQVFCRNVICRKSLH